MLLPNATACSETSRDQPREQEPERGEHHDVRQERRRHPLDALGAEPGHGRVQQVDEDQRQQNRREDDPNRVQDVPQEQIGEDDHPDGGPGDGEHPRGTREQGVRQDGLSGALHARSLGDSIVTVGLAAFAPSPANRIPPGREPEAVSPDGLGRLDCTMPPARSPASTGPRRGMSTRPIVVASNRGPVQFDLGEDGEIEQSRGGGGLVTGLTRALSGTGGLWVAAAMTEGDRVATERTPSGRIEVADDDAKYRVRYLSPEPAVFDRYYNLVSNRVLWFIHHYLFDAPRTPRFGRSMRDAWRDYAAVNREFASALAEEGGTGSAVPARSPRSSCRTTTSALVPRMLREQLPGRADRALLAHAVRRARLLPDPAHRDRRRGAARHARRRRAGVPLATNWAENFLLCCRHVDGAKVDLRRRIASTLDGRETRVGIYPIAIDGAALRARATSARRAQDPPRARAVEGRREDDPARRPDRPVEEHPPRVPGLRDPAPGTARPSRPR